MSVTNEPAFWLAAFGLFVILPFSIWWSYRLHKFWAEGEKTTCYIVVGGKEYKVGETNDLNDVLVEYKDGKVKVSVNGKEIQPEGESK